MGKYGVLLGVLVAAVIATACEPREDNCGSFITSQGKSSPAPTSPLSPTSVYCGPVTVLENNPGRGLVLVVLVVVPVERVVRR